MLITRKNVLFQNLKNCNFGNTLHPTNLFYYPSSRIVSRFGRLSWPRSRFGVGLKVTDTDWRPFDFGGEQLLEHPLPPWDQSIEDFIKFKILSWFFDCNQWGMRVQTPIKFIVVDLTENLNLAVKLINYNKSLVTSTVQYVLQ